MTGSTPSEPEEKAGSSDTPAASAQPASRDACAVVGIGASAGGLEAISHLLARLPPNTGMAYVLIGHLDPKHESNLVRILPKATPMPVHEPPNGMRAEPNK